MNAGPDHDRFREAIERAAGRRYPGTRTARMFRLKTLELLDDVALRRAAPPAKATKPVDPELLEDPFA